MLSFRRLIQTQNSLPSAFLKLWIGLIIAAMAMGCSPLLFQTNNLAETWPGSRWQGPTQVVIYGESPDSVVVFLEIDPARLTALRRGAEDVVRAVRLSFGVFTDFKPSHIIDTLSLRLTYPLAEQGNKPVERVRLKAPSGEIYQLWIRPEGQAARFYPIDRSNFQSDAEWLLTDKKGALIVNPNDLAQRPFVIHTTHPTNTLLIRRFNVNSCLPAPPFAENANPCNPTASVVGQLSLNGSQTLPVLLPGGGIYLVQADTSGEGGKYLSLMDDKTLDLITLYALRFVTTPEEYDDLMTEKIDPWDFWMLVAGSTQRAVQLSSAFKKSVGEACQLFSEELPGTLTDRGMIYLVFGPPDIVVTDKNTETWKYLPAETYHTFIFDFDIQRRRSGVYHYQLRRKPFYREPWLQAVERWRR